MKTRLSSHSRIAHLPSALGLLVALISFLAASPSVLAQSGVWTNLVNGNASGSWTNAANWANGVIAAGADNTADFSTLALTADSTVTLDGARTIGNLVFGNTAATPTNNWILATGSGGPLTLAVSSGQPTLTANNGSNTISAVLASPAVPGGITKTGSGLIRLNSANLLTNIVNNLAAGTLQLGNSSALGFVSGAVGTNNVAAGATLYLAAGVQPANQRVFLAGAGVGGTNGALRADAGSGNQQNTRWSYALNSVANPAIVLTGDATIRVDGSGYTTQAGFLVGAITNNTGDLAYTLTKTGPAELRIDPPTEVAVAAINVAEGVFGLNGNTSTITRTQAVTVASGAVLAARRNHTYNSSSSPLTLNGIFDLNYNSGAAANTSGNSWFQRVGSLAGGGAVTNSSLAPQILYVSGDTADSHFSGTVNPGANGAITLRKEGQDTAMWLTGSSTFNGTNIVAGGIEYIDGAWNPTNGGFIVGPQSGATSATLAGNGGTFSPIFLNSGGLVSAGDPANGGGTLAVNNILGLGTGDVIVSNANLIVAGSIGSAAGYVNSLYLTNATLTLPLSSGVPSVFANVVNVDGNVTLAYTSGNPAIGQFPLIAYGSLGGLAGGGTNGITLIPPAGTSAYLSNNAANATLDVVVTATPALVWNGNVNGDWDIGGTANWLNGVTPATYTETAGTGPFVVFDDSASGTTTVNLTTTVSPSGVTVNNSNRDYTFIGGGAIAGPGGLLKQGAGMLTLANGGTNSFVGPLTLSAGAVQVGNGGTTGNFGTASVVNNGQIIFNRGDDATFANVITGSGSLVKNGADTVTLSGIGDVSGSIAANAGTLALAPAGTITVSGDVTGGGAFGINSAGKVVLTSGNVTPASLLIAGGGTLELDYAVPPAGDIADNGTLALGVGGTLPNNISGTGGLTLLNGAYLTLAGANTYAGPTTVLGGGGLMADAANYPPASALILGSTNGAADVGSATFTSGDPVLGGLAAGGNNFSGDPIYLNGANQTLTINGNVFVGNTPSGANVYFPIYGSGVTVTVNTNGGVIQIGLGTQGSGINPDNVLVDFSGIDHFIANLGAGGALNLGTLDGNPGPSSGATVVNQFLLAAVSNAITAGTITVGAGGRQLTPELELGAGTNVFNVNTFNAGGGGRDGSYVHFAGGTGGLRLRANDGVSRAAFNVGVNPSTGTGASITNTVDFTGHPVDLLISNLVIGDYNNSGAYVNTFSFDTGTLDALSTSLSILRNNNANAAISGSTLNLNGGTASLGPVVLTASAAYGTLNVANATLTTANVTAPGAGVSTFSIANSTWNLALTNNGNPTIAPVFAQNFSASGAVALNVSGTNWTVGRFPLIAYTGALGGDGFAALNLTGLPPGVGGYLSNDVANLSVDLVITNAPAVIATNPTNLLLNVSGQQLTLSWPADHIGWLLQSNGVGLLDTNAWTTIPGTDGTNQFSATVDATKTNVFFRLLKP